MGLDLGQLKKWVYFQHRTPAVLNLAIMQLTLELQRLRNEYNAVIYDLTEGRSTV
jgi:hypothetical protein